MIKGLMNFSWIRMFSIAAKEWSKVKRDPTSIGFILGIPIVQIILVGYAINVFPKHLPTALINSDPTPMTSRFVQKIQINQYLDIKYQPKTRAEAEKLMQNGLANFIIEIPINFTRDMIRGEHPHILLQTDTTVPGALGYALKSLQDLSEVVFDRDLQGSLNYLKSTPNPFVIDFHSKYNPNLISTHTIVPSLIGIILTLSLTLVTSATITEENESGTIETLLNSPIQVSEIIVGKFICYLIIGYMQLISIVFLSTYVLFDVPVHGSYFLILLASLPFIMTNLMIGLAASALAQNQLQAQQIVTFFFLPSFLLSGFLFPFSGMPDWAQAIGNCLPVTHYNRIMAGIMLKGYTLTEVYVNLWPIIIFLIIITIFAIFSFRRTLD